MGILRLKSAHFSFSQILVFCTGCGCRIPYVEDPKMQYYEDSETQEVYCTSCIDSGKTMPNNNRSRNQMKFRPHNYNYFLKE